MSRSPRRAAAVVGAAGVAVALFTASASPAWAAPTAAGSATTTTTTTISAAPSPAAAVTTTTTTSTTTTTVPRPTTTTTTKPPPRPTTTKPKAPRATTTTKAPPRTTTTTRPSTTTTTQPKPPAKGVPNVPVGAPHLPASPGPPPDPTAILKQVQADLAQLTAIDDYAQARAAVANSQQAVTLATASVQTAVAAQSRAQAAQQAAQAHLDLATARVRGLAVAAYMGLGFITPAAGPQQVQQSDTGTVSSPGGLSGSAAVDALEMLRIVAQHERHDLRTSRVTVHEAERAVTTAAQRVADAKSSVLAAQSAVSASRQTLALVIKAATTPGLAASLDLPSLTSATSPSSAATVPAGGGGSGLSALAAPATSPPASAPPAPGSTTTVATNPIPDKGPGLVPAPAPASPSILGPSQLTGPELASWFASTGRRPHTTVPMPQLADDYAAAGQQTHVRADLAFAQSVVETDFFSFPAGGQLTPKDNNFAGIGACDTCARGWTFRDALTGVTAQMQLLDAYASPGPVPTNLVGNVGVGGCCPTWMELAGTWASNLQYGISIMTVYHQMLAWLIPQRLVAAGLLTPPGPAQTRAPAVGGAAAGAGAGPAPAQATAGSGAAPGVAALPGVASLPAQPSLAAQAVNKSTPPTSATTVAAGAPPPG